MCIDRTVKRGTDLCDIRVVAVPLGWHLIAETLQE